MPSAHAEVPALAPEHSPLADAPRTPWLTREETRLVSQALSRTLALFALVALGDLAVRAALRLELRSDTFAYHLPFAALRGGVPMPYDLNDQMRPLFESYPPLAHFLQGLLWRVTGSINATGVVNYLGLAGFLAYCHRVLRAPFWLVAPIALTAPLVVIHASVSYIDLFGNACLALGASSCLYVFLMPDEARPSALLGGLVGLAAACWTKYLLVPVAALLFVLFAATALGRPRTAGLRRRDILAFGVAAVLVAAIPYVKNWVVFGNPFWPIKLPFIGDSLPFTNDAIRGGAAEQPPQARQMSQALTFLYSLFEVGHPTVYPARPRWIIDQGNADVAFRMGGFWNVAVAFYLITVNALLWLCYRWRGLAASVGMLGVLGLVAFLPQSHQLRYYLFIPLAGAAAVGFSFRRFENLAPRVAPALLAATLGLFLHMVLENWTHYRVERIGTIAAAHAWGAADWWPRLRRGTTYCAVGMMPIGMLLTGPTLSQYRIVDRSKEALCPPGSVAISRPGHLR